MSTYQRCGAPLYSWGERGGARQLLDALPRLPALHGSSHSSSRQAQGDTDQPHPFGRLHSREAYTVGVLVTFFDQAVVVQAFFLTAAVVVGLTAFTFQKGACSDQAGLFQYRRRTVHR